MNHTAFAEINFLLRNVEQKFGSTHLSTNQFELLAAQLSDTTKESLSPSTLKRIWGYVADSRTPRVATLDILSRYCGYDDFRAFCTLLSDNQKVESCFFRTQTLRSAELPTGSTVEIGWLPDRSLCLTHLGEGRYEVTEAHNAKLTVGDRFSTTEFRLSHPLYTSQVERQGTQMPDYAAGLDCGLGYIVVNS